MRISKQDLVVFGVLAIAYVGTIVLRVPSDALYESKPKIIPPKILNHLNLGFKTVVADSLWLRVLQNDDFCENPSPKAAFNTAILLEEALKTKMAPSRCHKGWVYQMLDLITDLNPNFDWVYKTGGLMLSIGVDDREGARLIFEKGVAHTLEDWQLLYRAAYHYIFEIQNQERAAELLSIASLIPNVPGIIPILAARISRNEGRLEMARTTLMEYLKTAKLGTDSYNHALFRLKQLEAEMARLEAEKKSPKTPKK